MNSDWSSGVLTGIWPADHCQEKSCVTGTKLHVLKVLSNRHKLRENWTTMILILQQIHSDFKAIQQYLRVTLK